MVKFVDMPEGSRRGWLLWANSHDWGATVPAWFDEMTGELVTYGIETSSPRDVHQHFAEWRVIEARHKTPADLKAWAGY